jgi:hypothetical protein
MLIIRQSFQMEGPPRKESLIQPPGSAGFRAPISALAAALKPINLYNCWLEPAAAECSILEPMPDH